MKRSQTLGSLSCLLLALALIPALSSCAKDTPKAKAPVDERLNRGHDQPIFAELTLKEGVLKAGKTFSPNSSYEDVDFTGKEQKLEITNEIQTDKVIGGYDHASGTSHVVGSKEGATFHVESQGKVPGRVYALEIVYKNAHHKPMNDQLVSPEQVNRHQHFLCQVKSVTDAGYKYIESNEKSKLVHDYAYCDLYKGERTPVGLKGLIRFVLPTDDSGIDQAIHIALGHFWGSKFRKDKSVYPFYTPSRQKAELDINLQLLFHINK